MSTNHPVAGSHCYLEMTDRYNVTFVLFLPSLKTRAAEGGCCGRFIWEHPSPSNASLEGRVSNLQSQNLSAFQAPRAFAGHTGKGHLSPKHKGMAAEETVNSRGHDPPKALTLGSLLSPVLAKTNESVQL